MSITLASPTSRFFAHTVIDDFLGPDLVQSLLDHCAGSRDRFAPATVRLEDGTRVDPGSRIALALEDLGQCMAPFESRLRAAEPIIRESLGMGAYDLQDIELQIAAHNDGAFFRRHNDSQKGWNMNRVISAVYYFHRLPCAFSGGALRLYPLTGEGHVDLAPAHNRLVAFPSFVQHEVLPVACPSGEFMDSRFAVNCWFRRVPKPPL